MLAALVAVGRRRGDGAGAASRAESAAPSAAGRERRGLLIAVTLTLACLGVPVLLAATGLDYVFTRNLLPLWLVLG